MGRHWLLNSSSRLSRRRHGMRWEIVSTSALLQAIFFRDHFSWQCPNNQLLGYSYVNLYNATAFKCAIVVLSAKSAKTIYIYDGYVLSITWSTLWCLQTQLLVFRHAACRYELCHWSIIVNACRFIYEIASASVKKRTDCVFSCANFIHDVGTQLFIPLKTVALLLVTTV